MPARFEVYQCKHCGNIVEVLHGGAAPLICCGEPMKLLREGSTDGASEKHVPVIEKTENGYKVKVGSAAHPMAEDHYIEWIEVINGAYVNRCHLKPGDAPQAAFYVPMQPGLVVRAYCNKHGLWKK